MIFRSCLAVIAILVAGCSDPEQYVIETSPSEVKVRAAVKRILVRTVSLPTYAAAEEIAFQDETGAIRANKTGLWADEPERATTLVISRHLNQMTSSTVAPEPWPLGETPQAVVDIRVEQFLATNRATLRLSGQYFLGGEEESTSELTDEELAAGKRPRRTFPSKSRLFDIQVPLPGEGLPALAAAQSAALRILSEKIARDLAR